MKDDLDTSWVTFESVGSRPKPVLEWIGTAFAVVLLACLAAMAVLGVVLAYRAWL